MAMDADSFFTEYGEANRFTIHEVIGKGSYGVVCSATDSKTGEKVAIKKITDVFEHVSDATRILREVKLLRVLKHPDIVEVKHIVLNNDADLSEVELAVIGHRFGLSDDKAEAIRRTLTLEQVGQIIGVTKERVRQIQNKALAKIRLTLEEVTPNETPAISPN